MGAGVPFRPLSSIPGVARVLHAPGLAPGFSTDNAPGVWVVLFGLGVCGVDMADAPRVAPRIALELGLESLDVWCDGGDFDRDSLRELPAAGRSGDSAFFARRGELTGVVSSPDTAVEPLHGSCSGSTSSAGLDLGDAGKGGS